MKHRQTVVFLTALLLLGLIPSAVLGVTYVFPYEGFRYTQQDGEVVLTQTNLEENAALIDSLGTTSEAVLSNYLLSGIAMEVIPNDGGQISVSVMDDPFFGGSKSMSELTMEEKQQMMAAFTGSGLYETCAFVSTDPQCIRLTSSAMYASMPVYSLRYVTLSYGKLYTLSLPVIGRALTDTDDAAIVSVLGGMKMFAPRVQPETEVTAAEETEAQPETVTTHTAEVQILRGNISLIAMEDTVYSDTILFSGTTDANAQVRIYSDGVQIGEGLAGTEGTFAVRGVLTGLGEHEIHVVTDTAEAQLQLTYSLPLAQVTILEPEERSFTGESILLRGTTVPNATIYITGDQINTNVVANQNGAFSIRLTFDRPGAKVLHFRSRATGYAEYTMDVTFTRVQTEREVLAEFRAAVISLDYNDFVAAPERYADSKFIFRGKIMEYTDYNGKPCALICVSNPSTGNWKDPLYIVIDGDEIPEIGEVMTFYLTSEGITLPADGIYTQSGNEEEVPVTRSFYLTANR